MPGALFLAASAHGDSRRPLRPDRQQREEIGDDDRFRRLDRVGMLVRLARGLAQIVKGQQIDRRLAGRSLIEHPASAEAALVRRQRDAAASERRPLSSIESGMRSEE